MAKHVDRRETNAICRRARVAILYLRGNTQVQISKIVGVSRGVVGNDMKKIREEWRERFASSYQEHVDRELARLDLIESEAWDAWQRSKLDAIRKQVATEKTSEGKTTKGTKTRIGQCGEPRYLEIALKCHERRCKVLKIDTATDEPAGGGEVIRTVEVVVEDREQVAAVLNFSDYVQRVNGGTASTATEIPKPGESNGHNGNGHGNGNGHNGSGEQNSAG